MAGWAALQGTAVGDFQQLCGPGCWFNRDRQSDTLRLLQKLLDIRNPHKLVADTGNADYDSRKRLNGANPLEIILEIK